MLCAGSKRRRNRAEMQDAKEEEMLRGEALDIKQKQIDELQQQLHQQSQMLDNFNEEVVQSKQKMDAAIDQANSNEKA